jgi:tRNA pseudouridine32 synthase / 23S rRNA pseudouridine746 synthase
MSRQRDPSEWRPGARDGVPPSCVALPHDQRWSSLSAFLAWRLPALTLDQWRARMSQGAVLDGKGQPLVAEAAYQPGSKVWYWREVEDEADIPLAEEVLHVDEHLVVVDKPHFVPMSPVGRYARDTLLARVQRRLGLDDLCPIHRLDRETAGVVVMCRRPADRNAYQQLFRAREVTKVYEARAPYRPELSFPRWQRSRMAPSGRRMQMMEVPGEPNAVTWIELLSHNSVSAHYRLHPHTGKTHQLRVHMHALGLPLLGDTVYPDLQPELAPGELPDLRRPLQLLARSIHFTDPVTGVERRFESRRELRWEDGV